MNTTEKNIAIIALRIMAIYLAIQVINLIPSWVSAIATPFITDTRPPIWLILLGLALLIGSFILPVIIWLTSKRLASFIIRDKFIPVSNSIDLSQIGSIIFTSVGLLVFLLVFPELIVWICQMFVAMSKSNLTYQAPMPSWWLLVVLLLKTLLSLFLILRSNIIFQLIKRINSL